MTIRTPAGPVNRYPLPDLTLGEWNDMVYHFRFSADKTGLVEVWLNGDQVVAYRGATAWTNGDNAFYNKIGLYRDRWRDPMTIFFDNYALGDARLVVDPSRVDRSHEPE